MCGWTKKQKGWCVVMESRQRRLRFDEKASVLLMVVGMRSVLVYVCVCVCVCVCVSTMTISPACLWVQQSKPHKWPTIRQQTHRGNKTARQSDFSTEALELRKWRGIRSFRQPCVPFLMCPVLNWWPLLESLYVIIKCNGWITILRMGNMAHMEHWEDLMCFYTQYRYASWWR